MTDKSREKKKERKDVERSDSVNMIKAERRERRNCGGYIAR